MSCCRFTLPRQLPSMSALFPYTTLFRSQFTFTGSAAEYFRIWIVNVALSVITLGIYSAWAKVRTKHYFYGHAHLHGSSFEYLARSEERRVGTGCSYGWAAGECI